MNVKKHIFNRSTEANKMSPPTLKNVEKTKARQELWDSLLEVYEKQSQEQEEVEVSVEQLDQMEVVKPVQHFRTTKPLAHIKHHVIHNTYAGAVDLDDVKLPDKKRKRTSKLTKTDNQTSEKSIKRSKGNKSSNVSQIHKHYKQRVYNLSKKTKNCKNLTFEKGKKKIVCVKTPAQQKTPLSKKIKIKKNSAKLKLVEILDSSGNTFLEKKSASKIKVRKYVGQDKVNLHNKEITENCDTEINKKDIAKPRAKTCLTLSPINQVKNKTQIKTGHVNGKGNGFQHKCKLKLRPYDKITKPSTRADGRTFICNLIFKVCECELSEERF